MSYRPRAFAVSVATMCVLLALFPQNHAIESSTPFGSSQFRCPLSRSPLYVALPSSALAAYSYSASVGNRYSGQSYGVANISLGEQLTLAPLPVHV